MARSGRNRRTVSSAARTLSTRAWLALPWVENDSSATRGSPSSRLLALSAEAMAMSASSWALGSALMAQSAKI